MNCDECSDVILEDEHTAHDDGCTGINCTCDRWFHSECCPVCNSETVDVSLTRDMLGIIGIALTARMTHARDIIDRTDNRYLIETWTRHRSRCRQALEVIDDAMNTTTQPHP